MLRHLATAIDACAGLILGKKCEGGKSMDENLWEARCDAGVCRTELFRREGKALLKG